MVAEFLDGLGVRAHASWLDVGCGVDSLTEMIAGHAAPSTVVGADSSAAFLELALSQVPSASGSSRKPPNTSRSTTGGSTPPSTGWS